MREKTENTAVKKIEPWQICVRVCRALSTMEGFQVLSIIADEKTGVSLAVLREKAKTRLPRFQADLNSVISALKSAGLVTMIEGRLYATKRGRWFAFKPVRAIHRLSP